MNVKYTKIAKDMIPDRDNVVYYDTELERFYMIVWEDDGNRDIAHRIYIDKVN